MSEVIVKTTFRVTRNKGKTRAQEVYEFEQRISEDDHAFTTNSKRYEPSANQDEEKRTVTISLEC